MPRQGLDVAVELAVRVGVALDVFNDVAVTEADAVRVTRRCAARRRGAVVESTIQRSERHVMGRCRGRVAEAVTLRVDVN